MIRKKQMAWAILFFFWWASFSIPQAQTATLVGENQFPTGLLELTEYHYPVYLFIPETYKAEQAYPLLIVFPGEGESPKKHIENWTGIAKRKSLIILSPGLNFRESEGPFKADEWLLRIKQEVMSRYRVSPDRIYLIGTGPGARYAGYLAVKYPEEFSAAALLDGSWVGPFEKLVRPSKRMHKQMPFFVSLHQNKDNVLLQQTEERSYVYTQKGYPVYFEKVDEKEDFSSSEFRKRMLTWLEDETQSWRRVVRESKKTIKDKLEDGVANFFTVK